MNVDYAVLYFGVGATATVEIARSTINSRAGMPAKPNSLHCCDRSVEVLSMIAAVVPSRVARKTRNASAAIAD
jgi:hypothetical protein